MRPPWSFAHCAPRRPARGYGEVVGTQTNSVPSACVAVCGITSTKVAQCACVVYKSGICIFVIHANGKETNFLIDVTVTFVKNQEIGC